MILRTFFLSLFFLLVIEHFVDAQNWSTYGGGSYRNALSSMTGPGEISTPVWNVASGNQTNLAQAIYSFGDRFVTSRIKFSPYSGLIECRRISDGLLLWTSPNIRSTSILYAIGFTEDAVYAHDYNNDSLYALSPENGLIKWRGKVKSQTFGAYPGVVYSCDGDLILNAPVASGNFTMRVDKHNGQVKWFNKELIAIGPAVGLAATETTVYRITGGITLPIRLTAMDVETGKTKYSSAPIPGDGDQENPIMIGSDGIIYFWRDGGSFYAYEDTGSDFVKKWEYMPQITTGVALSGNMAEAMDGNIYIFDNGYLKKISHSSGEVLMVSVVDLPKGSICVGVDSTVYVNDQEGKYYALTDDLQIVKWNLNLSGNHYCAPAILQEGVMVLAGGGYNIRAYQTAKALSPVADFRASVRRIRAGESIDFYDQSSYVPEKWNWEFEGAEIDHSDQQHPKSIRYLNPGIFTVGLQAENGLGSHMIAKDCYVEVLPATSVADFDKKMTIRLFPNPSHDVIYF
ncbi:MAG TPA: PQQ-binding-like beta-propeller repeat protein, partial [Saprospiraceae bacterium]|nr:PQQ-binding-like beta-propeller repeat protein [Saprospiraceae bacterium]